MARLYRLHPSFLCGDRLEKAFGRFKVNHKILSRCNHQDGHRDFIGEGSNLFGQLQRLCAHTAWRCGDTPRIIFSIGILDVWRKRVERRMREHQEQTTDPLPLSRCQNGTACI